MLAQILRDMYIDPVMLAGLDETQKQTLFCKMREEQIRRWRLWDQSFRAEDDDDNERVECRRAVRFLQGEDGEPWVWVMGEHLNDRSIDEILADEAKQRARELAEIETKEFRKSYVAEMSSSNMHEYDSDTTTTTTTTTQANKATTNEDDVNVADATPQIDEMEIYCSVDELRERIQVQKYNALNNMTTIKKQAAPPPPVTITPTVVTPAAAAAALPRIKLLNNNIASATRLVNFNLSSSQPIVPGGGEVLKEISTNKPTHQKVSAKIALWEKRVIGEATNEIYRRLQRRQQETAIEAEEAARKREELWQEQERRAKEAEVHKRDIARRAREEHRKSINCEPLPQPSSSSSSGSESSQHSNSSPPSSLDSNISRPSSQEAVVQWYETDEYGRGSGIDAETGRPCRWFHGLVRRIDAEQRLANEPAGTFLVRLSEKIWGYAISYKDTDRCKHYLVDATNGTYQFLGANQLSHNSLSECDFFFINKFIFNGIFLFSFRRINTIPCECADHSRWTRDAGAAMLCDA